MDLLTPILYRDLLLGYCIPLGQLTAYPYCILYRDILQGSITRTIYRDNTLDLYTAYYTYTGIPFILGQLTDY